MEHSTPTIHLVNGLKSLVETLENQDTSLNIVSDLPDHEPATRQSRTSLVETANGHSSYCDADLQSLCDDSCFESVMWLLIHRSRPDHEQLADAVAILNDAAVIDRPLAEAISTVPLQTRPLDFLTLSISLLSCFDPTPTDASVHASRSQFWTLMAQLPVLMHVALGGDIQDGRPVFPSGCSDPDISADVDVPSSSWAGRLLQILRADNCPVSATEEHAMNVLMTCECITNDRAADLTARSVGTAVTDITAAWKASSAVFVSQLRNDPYAWTASLMHRFVNPSYAEQWWHSRKGKPMPFGFSDAPEEDRSMLLREQCRELLGSVPAMVMEASCSRLEAVRADDKRFPTTDWTATRLLSLLGVPEDRISVAIGMARLVGWAAHHLDQCECGSVD